MSEIALSTKGMKQAGLLDDRDKFTFIIGKDKKEFRCSRFQACFISKRVCTCLSSDPTLERLQILPDYTCSHFNLIEDLWNGHSISVDSQNREELTLLSHALDNDELCNLIQSGEELSRENCVSMLRKKQVMGLDTTNEITYIASNFLELQISVIELLTVSELEQILVHDSLQLDSENALFEMILQLSSRNDEYSSLLRYIRFEFMDSEHVASFMDAIYPDRIDLHIWESITDFVIRNLDKNTPQKKPISQPRESSSDLVIEYNEASPLKGICAHLMEECLGNPCLKGLVDVTSSSVQFGAEHWELINYEGWKPFSTLHHEPNQWVQFDFKDRQIALSSYTVKGGFPALRQWKVEMSNDSTNWILVDEKFTDLLKSGTKHFQCSHPTQDFFRYIRITSTGPNWGDGNTLSISKIEFFGRLRT